MSLENDFMNTDKRFIGEQNRLAVLTNLHRFGWLTNRMLAALIWPAASQSVAMARRTVKSLVDEKLILRRPLPNGGDCFVLSTVGARFLGDELGITAHSGNAHSLGNPMHRACANWHAIQCMNNGHQVWTEHEIQTARAPLVSYDGKIPDVLIETEHGIIWVEVENAWKNRHERNKIFEFCTRNLAANGVLKELVPGSYLFRVAVVGTNPDSLRTMWHTFTDGFNQKRISERQAADIDFVLLPIDKSLNVGDELVGNLLYDGIIPYQ